MGQSQSCGRGRFLEINVKKAERGMSVFRGGLRGRSEDDVTHMSATTVKKEEKSSLLQLQNHPPSSTVAGDLDRIPGADLCEIGTKVVELFQTVR